MQALAEGLQSTKRELTDLIKTIDEKQVDTVPFEDSWTAGQLLEHIDKAVNPGLLKGNVQPTDRPADEKVAQVKKIFLDFNTKLKSPEFIEPREQAHDKNVLQQSLSEKFDELTDATNTLDLQQECVDFEVPGMGRFTRLEWISFYMIHTQRHIHQLKNIITKLQEKNVS
ncbi:MAG: DinB family protein [Rhizobacter sp.]|nr:DinB family protein [Ferruginibacter sp.]